MDTFGAVLYQFCLSVDIVTDETRNGIFEECAKYLSDAFEINFAEFLTEVRVDNKPGLATKWVKGGGEDTTSLYDNSAPNGQTARAFINNRPLWIVGDDHARLSKANFYREHWSGLGSDEIPKYIRVNKNDASTSIIIPVLENGEVYGVLNFESDSVLRVTASAQKELSLISLSLSILHLLQNARRLQSESTRSAILRLRATRELYTSTFKLSVFVASSGRADRAVISSMKECLGKFGEDLELVYWEDTSDPGDINEHVTRSIVSCLFGVCYLSEPVVVRSSHKFQDNPNVLFEAGMLHALAHRAQLAGKPVAWIPIRERDSPEFPFDIASQRTLLVPRTKNGVLEREKFAESLRERVNSVLKKHQPRMNGPPALPKSRAISPTVNKRRR